MSFDTPTDATSVAISVQHKSVSVPQRTWRLTASGKPVQSPNVGLAARLSSRFDAYPRGVIALSMPFFERLKSSEEFEPFDLGLRGGPSCLAGR